MKVWQLPKDILENNIFYYLDSQDLINLYLVNKEFHSRLYPIRLLELLGINDDFWPCLKFITRDDDWNDDKIPYFEELSKSRWRFIKFTVDSLTFSHIKAPKSFELNLVVHRIPNSNKFIQLLNSNIVTELNIDFNSTITMEAIKAIIQNLHRMSRLNTLAINSKKLDIGFALALQKSLALTQIKTLDLKTSGIDDDFLAILCHVLPHTKIEILVLYSNKIGNQGMQNLAEILPATNIQELVLSYNLFGVDGLKSLAKGLIGSSVKSLAIPSIKIAQDCIPELFDNFHLMKLEKFESYRYIGHENTTMLIKNLPKSNIKQLVVDIHCDYLQDFIVALSTSKVTDLYLCNEDANKCCDILASNMQYIKLEKLRLGKRITNTGIQALMSTMEHITELDLQENFHLGDREMKIIAHYLSRTKLKRLCLSGCNFEDHGLELLLQGLKGSQVDYLEMRYLKASTQAVQDFVKQCTCKVLDVSYAYNLDKTTVKYLAEMRPQLSLIFQ
ncbi:hypothetical protein HDV01_006498 [Terramyces sp. JEL0728]|nr:hypothetical protein HDV01_006498 [Terramyces sp. JEL0728]